ncbi:MAG: hypothetical protein QOD74_2660 [Variibacter sp.]|nr:hypothetical protein [Variibacter sp.]
MKHAIRDWIAFWNSENSIYVNARHRDVHYAAIADALAMYVPHRDAIVLDYGCGEALHAERVAARCKELILCEAAPAVRAQVAARFRDHSKITVRSPEEVLALPDASLDCIAMVSVAQYLSPEMLDSLLRQFRRLLRPQGMLVLGDIVPSGTSPLPDALALLRFAAENGFVTAALGGLARTAFSDYSKLRMSLGLSTYDAPAILAKLAAAGFAGERRPVNVGHNQRRMTFVGRPA